MSFEERFLSMVRDSTIHMSLLDPEGLTAESAIEIARRVKAAGTDAFMIGGSTGVTSENLTEITLSVKKATGLPVIYFPSDPSAMTKEVDGMFFMSIVNSGNPDYIFGYHSKVAPQVRALGIGCISMAYIIVEPGMTVARVTDARCVPQDDPGKAAGYALAAEMMGFRLIYLEAGSGADRPVPPAMISAVKKAVSCPVIVGGGIHTPGQAEAARRAGADAIVTGTFLENCTDDSKLVSVVHAAKGIRHAGPGLQQAPFPHGEDVDNPGGEGRGHRSQAQGRRPPLPLPRLRQGVQSLPVTRGRLQILSEGIVPVSVRTLSVLRQRIPDRRVHRSGGQQAGRPDNAGLCRCTDGQMGGDLQQKAIALC